MEYRDFLKSSFDEKFIDELLTSINKKPISGLRLNTLKCQKLEITNNLKKHPYVEIGYLFDKEILPLGKSYYHDAGCYYIQEPSAMMVGKILNVKEENKVIDLCAAPGGKSTHIAAYLNNTGLLVSNDINYQRALALSDNIERLGIKNCIVISEEIEKLSKFQGFFDRVCLDAPCSGEGMFRKNKEAEDDWSVEKVERLSKVQKELIMQAYRLLKKDGLMTYSTCTFNKHENEEVVKYLLDNTNASLETIDDIKGVDRGLDMKEAIRIFPTSFEGEGHFVALIKCNDEHETDYINRFKSNIDKNSLAIFYTFAKSNLTINFDNSNLYINNNHLYYLPKDAFSTQGLRTLRSGLYLGEIKGKFFVPSHALALATSNKDWIRVVKLDDSNIDKYIKGLSFPYDLEDGYALVTYNSYSIGVCKIANKILKNYYPKYLRR